MEVLPLKKTQNGARTKVSRGDVVVFNAGYENKRLTVRTLRVLAAALPEAYPIPQQLPESHLEPEDSITASIRGTSASRRRVRPQFQPIFPRRGRNRGGSAQTESEEEEEEDEVEEDEEEEDDESDESTDDENENPDSHQQSTNAGYLINRGDTFRKLIEFGHGAPPRSQIR